MYKQIFQEIRRAVQEIDDDDKIILSNILKVCEKLKTSNIKFWQLNLHQYRLNNSQMQTLHNSGYDVVNPYTIRCAPPKYVTYEYYVEKNFLE